MSGVRYLLLFVLLAAGLMAPAQEGCMLTAKTGQQLAWKPQGSAVSRKLLRYKGKRKLPVRYEVFTIDAAGLRTYLEGLSKATTVTLPAGGGACIDFRVEASGTLSPELARKYGLVSLKGQGVPEKQWLLRLDSDGKTMQAEIAAPGGDTYILEPWPGKGRQYYLLYRKIDGAAGSRLYEQNTP